MFKGIDVGRSFLGQVPIASGCCVLISRDLQKYLPVLEEDAEQQLEESGTEPKVQALAFDFPGAISLAIGITSLLTVINLQNQLSWGHPLLLSITIVGVLSSTVFLTLETFPGNRELLIPLRLLKTEIGAFCAAQVSRVHQTACHRQFTITWMLAVLPSSYSRIRILIFLLATYCGQLPWGKWNLSLVDLPCWNNTQLISQIAPYFANTQGASDTEAGTRTIPSSIGNALGNLIAGQVIRKYACLSTFFWLHLAPPRWLVFIPSFGRYKRLSIVSLLLCIATSLAILLQWSHPISTSFVTRSNSIPN